MTTLSDIPVRGTLTANAPLAPLSWFKVGGMADWLFKPADSDDLLQFLHALPADMPVTVLGVGSNLIIRDGGIEGVVIKLGRGFTDVTVDGDIITAGSAALDSKVAQVAAQAGLSGLEFLTGVPGAIGGAIKMNAGCYGGETATHLIDVTLATRQGLIIRTKDQLAFAYRHSSLSTDEVVVSARFRGQPDDSAAIRIRMAEINATRAAAQPLGTKTCGSTFRNPEGGKAWQLIDQAGCRGLRVGDAEMSALHCNFMINHGQASAADLEMLGEEVRRRVLATSGISLEWEIKRIGRPLLTS